MEDDLILLQSGQYVGPNFNRGNFAFNSKLNSMSNLYQNGYVNRAQAYRTTDQELALLSEQNFNFNRRRGSLRRAITGKSKNYMSDLSKELKLRGVTQEDYTKLSNLDLFRGGSLSDVTDVTLSESLYQKNRKTGVIGRTKGDALSLLGESDIEALAEVVSARQGNILGNTLSPGLQSQGFSLLSGNFGR